MEFVEICVSREEKTAEYRQLESVSNYLQVNSPVLSSNLFVRTSLGEEGLFVVWKVDPFAHNYTMAIQFSGMMEDFLYGLKQLFTVHLSLSTKSFMKRGSVLLREIEDQSAHPHDNRLVILEEENDVFFNSAVQVELKRPWDLEGSQFLYRLLVHKSSENFKICMSMHHIICDEWSVKVLLEDFQSSLHLSPILLPELQIWDFAEWEWKNSDTILELKDWWTRYLQDADVLKMEKIAGTRERSVGVRIPFKVDEFVRQEASNAGITLFAAWQGIFTLWLWINSERGAESPLICGPYGRRDNVSYSRTVGFLLNMVVFKYNFSNFETMSFKDFLQASSRSVSITLEYGANFPFSVLVRDCGLKNSENLMNTTFAWVTDQILPIGVSKDLSAKSNISGNSCGRVFSVNLVEKLTLSGLFRIPQRFPKTVSFSLQESNWHKVAFSKRFSIASCLKHNKDAVVPPILQSFTGVLAVNHERSKTQVLAEYAAVLVGAGFLPIDADYVVDVVRFRIEDANCSLVFSSLKKMSINHSLEQKKFFSLEKTFCWLKPAFTPNNIAYIIHTSGSTGKPKGVSISYVSLGAFLLWKKFLEFQWSSGDSIAFSTSISFDIAMTMRFWPIVQGNQGKLIVMAQSLERNATESIKFLEQGKVSCIFMTPSTLTMLNSAGKGQYSQNLKLIMVIGEAFSWLLEQQLKKVEVWNVYGPTEATVAISFFQVKAESKPCFQTSSVPIGKAFTNSSMDLFSGSKLFLLGPQIGLGYMNRQKETKAVFIYNTFENNAAERLYSSGDLATLLYSDDYECFGRNDDQVKISGHRVELNLVKAEIMACPDVSACEVIMQQRKSEKFLVAFFVGGNRQNILSRISARLLRHEIPRKFVNLDQMPLTTAGKADRTKLAMTMVDTKREIEPIEKPQVSTEIEQKLQTFQNFYCDCIGIEKTGVEKTFLQLGGTSLQAVEIQLMIKSSMNIEYPLKFFYQDGSLKTIFEDFLNASKSSQKGDFRDQNFHPMMWLSGKERFVVSEKASSGNHVVVLVPGLCCTSESFARLSSSKFLDTIVCEGGGCMLSPQELANLFYEGLKKYKVFCIAGHSFGGAVAFELVQIFQKHGFSPILVLLDSVLQQPELKFPSPNVRNNLLIISILSTLDDVSALEIGILDAVRAGVLANSGYSQMQAKELWNQISSERFERHFDAFLNFQPSGRTTSEVFFLEASPAVAGNINLWQDHMEREIKVIKIESSHFQIPQHEETLKFFLQILSQKEGEK